MEPTTQGAPEEGEGASGVKAFGEPQREAPRHPKVQDKDTDRLEREARKAYSSISKASKDKTLAQNLGIEKLQAEQDLRRQIIRFRRILFYFLLMLMTVETLAVFVIIVLASLPSPILAIKELTLQVLVGATIAQISAMLIVIIRSVYPDSLNKLITPDKGR